jgi:hypothetical protein
MHEADCTLSASHRCEDVIGIVRCIVCSCTICDVRQSGCCRQGAEEHNCVCSLTAFQGSKCCNSEHELHNRTALKILLASASPRALNLQRGHCCILRPAMEHVIMFNVHKHDSMANMACRRQVKRMKGWKRSSQIVNRWTLA